MRSGSGYTETVSLLVLALIGCSEPEPAATPQTTDTSATTTPSTVTWDPSPAAAERGSILRVEVDCGLLEGTPVREFRKIETDGDLWEMLLPATPDVHPEVLPCTQETQDYLEWLDNGDFEVLASDLWHELSPTATPNRWVGTTWPQSGSTPECDASLAQLGLEWPVHLSMTVVEIVPP